MKLDTRTLPAFLRDSGACRVVLLHGDDSGLIRERAETLVRQVAGSLDDPFRVAELDRDGVARIPDEIATRPMTGGRRVVRVREATDAATAPVQAALAGNGEGLVVIEAGELTGRSRLRGVVEAAADGAAIACYGEQGADLARTITRLLGEAGLAVEEEALAYLTEHLGADRGSTRQELDKLALYVGPGAPVDLDSAMIMVGDMAGLQLEDALYAATSGDVLTADRALALALAAGATPVGVLRATLMHLQKLERVQAAVRAGRSADDAVRSLRPPIFFRRQRAFATAAGRWSADALAGAARAVWDAELACKQTGSPGVILCRRSLLAIARRTARRR